MRKRCKLSGSTVYCCDIIHPFTHVSPFFHFRCCSFVAHAGASLGLGFRVYTGLYPEPGPSDFLAAAAAVAAAAGADTSVRHVSLEPRVWDVFEASLLELVSGKEENEGSFKKFLGWLKYKGPFEVRTGGRWGMDICGRGTRRW